MPSNTFSVVAEAHLRLAKANGVFACANAIELLKFCLIDALCTQLAMFCFLLCSNGLEVLLLPASTYLTWEVDLNGLYANVLGSCCHDCASIYFSVATDCVALLYFEIAKL